VTNTTSRTFDITGTSTASLWNNYGHGQGQKQEKLETREIEIKLNNIYLLFYKIQNFVTKQDQDVTNTMVHGMYESLSFEPHLTGSAS